MLQSIFQYLNIKTRAKILPKNIIYIVITLYFVLVIPVVVVGAKTFLNIQIMKLQEESIITFTKTNINGRYLQQNSQQSTTSTSMWDQNSKTNIYMILLIIGLCLLVIGGIVCCIVIMVRYYLGANRIVNANRVANDPALELDLQMICPQINYGLFVREIGQPLHDNCVICLEPFMNCGNIVVNQEHNESAHELKAKKQQLTVSLTVCGHLIHASCLEQWINRQPNCPLCRQSFSDQNLTEWQQKLNIDYSNIYKAFKLLKDQHNKKGQRKLRTNKRNQCTLRDSLQLQWLKHYKDRPIFNKQRHAKYSIESVFNRYTKPQNKKSNLTQISNQHDCITPITECNSVTKKNNIQDSKLTYDEIYALMIYSCVMDYHEAKNIKKDVQIQINQEKDNNKQQKCMQSKIESNYNGEIIQIQSSSQQSSVKYNQNQNQNV